MFRLGTVYSPRQGMAHGRRPRRLLGYSVDSLRPGGKVEVALVSSGRRRVMAGAAWAGEPVGDVGR